MLNARDFGRPFHCTFLLFPKFRIIDGAEGFNTDLCDCCSWAFSSSFIAAFFLENVSSGWRRKICRLKLISHKTTRWKNFAFAKLILHDSFWLYLSGDGEITLIRSCQNCRRASKLSRGNSWWSSVKRRQKFNWQSPGAKKNFFYKKHSKLYPSVKSETALKLPLHNVAPASIIICVLWAMRMKELELISRSGISSTSILRDTIAR